MRNYSAYLILIATLLALILMPVNTVQAATLTVNQTGTQTDSGDDDGTCSLIDAIQVANGTAVDSDCGSGDSGSDTIVLAGGATYNLPVSNDNTDGANGLPSITSTIVIDGNGATITRTGITDYRIFHIAAGGNLTLNHTTITNGRAISGQVGGAIFSRGILTVNDSMFFNNFAPNGGGAIVGFFDPGVTTTINRSTFQVNSTNEYGGAISVFASVATITNSTFSGNSAGLEGGAIQNNGNTTITASTFMGNSATNDGAGIVALGGTLTTVGSSIFDNAGNNCHITSALTNNGNNLSTDSTCSGFGTTTSGALNLGGLANNGGLTETHMPGAGSSAIDAASSCATTSDQRGVGRPVGINCDIGSVEVGTPGFTIDEGGGVDVDEEGPTSDSYIVTVNTPPTADLEFSIFADSQCEITSPNPVIIAAQSAPGFIVDVQAIDDDLFEASPHTCVITHSVSSGDPLYNGIFVANVNVSVTDNDTPAIIVDPIEIDISEDGTTATYSIVLATQPENTVNLTVAPDDECIVDSLAPEFNDTNWNTPQIVTVEAVDDGVDEGTHTCVITHSASSLDFNYDSITIDDVTATIADNDTAAINVNPTTISLAEGGPSQTYTLTLDTPPADTVFIDFIVSPLGECTVLSGDTLEIFAGEIGPFTIVVIAVDDEVIDGAHTCTISHLATSDDAPYDGIDIDDVTANITDNDSAGLAYNPNPRSITEGGPGQDYQIFLNTLPSADVEINITTDGQCTITSTNPVTIPSSTLGPTTVTVVAVDDTDIEASPHICAITHTVSSPDSNYNFVDTDFFAEVTDNDDVTINIDDVAVLEGNTGTVIATFTVSLNTTSAQTIAVDWVTTDNTATTADGDYDTDSDTVTFAPGETSQPITVTVNGDDKYEDNETFFVNLSNATNATIGDNQGIGTITNDDSQPEINIDNPPAVVEGNAGQTPVTFTVSLTNASYQTITVNWQTADNTATTAGNDYNAGGPATLTFLPDAPLTQTVTVQVNGDTLDEPDETFFVNLSGATNATINVGTGIGTIIDDDPQPAISIDNPSMVEGNALTTNITFTVSLSAASGQTVTVDWTTADNTATTADNDYNADSDSVTFAPGETTQTLTIQIVGDTTPEPDETFFVNLTNPTNATIDVGQGTGTILDDDTALLPTLSINSPPAVIEGDVGTTDIIFTVTLSAASAQVVTVNWSTADDTATAGSDYTAVPTLITFNPGDLTQTLTVQVIGDTLDEVDETFFVNLATPTNATIDVGQGIGTITDDDDPPTISINNQTVAEDGGTINFTVSLSEASGQTVTVNWTTADDTATAGSDYTAVITPTLLTFAPGVVTQPVPVTIIDDTMHEPDETFFVNLSGATNATINVGTGIGTITDNDPIPSITIFDQSVVEGDSGITPAVFTLNLSNPSSQPVTVEWTTADSTATTADNDYAGVTMPDTVTFTPGTTMQTLTVNVNGDTAVEPDEDFTVNLSNPTNATIADGEATGTILNDDALPTISIGDVSVTEGDSGQVAANFTVTLSAATPQVVTVDWATGDGSATVADNDYDAASGTVTFPANDATPQIIIVFVNGDTAIEPDEDFFVNLSNPTNATIAVGQGTGTIINDDVPPPTISIDSPSTAEGNAGTATITFTVTLSAASAQTVTVDWSTADGTATTADNDYVANGGTLTFIPGNVSQTIPVVVNGDMVAEANETFFVNLSNPTNATILVAQGTGTIITDDAAPPTVSIGDVNVTEGNSGQVAANFTVTISAATPQVVTVDWTTADVSATTTNNDYVAGSGTVTFPANDATPQTITVFVNGDTAVEPDETFTVILSNPVNATILDGLGVGTIINDDSPPGVPTLRINDVSDTEGNSGTKTFSFTVTREGSDLSATSTVNYATANNTAMAGSDYVAASGTLTFTANVTTQTISVTVNGDTTVEPDETFVVNLSSPTNATITDAQGIGTIINDDTTTGTPTIRINDVTANEGNSGTTPFTFTLTRSGNLSGTSSVTVTTANNSATAGSDYFGVSQVISFSPSQATRTVIVQVVGDTTVEANEVFLVNLSSPINATISDGQGVGTIINDDGTTTPPSTNPTATPIPVVPPVPLCADLTGTTNPIIRAQIPAGTVTNGNVFCRVLAQNGQFVGGSPPETVGHPQVLSLGVIHAVDVYALAGGSPIIAFNNSVTVCLQGSGSMVYLDATQAPRPPVILTNATSDGTYTCVNIPNAGTVVLVQSGGNLPGVNTGSGGSGGPSQNLSGCVVTPSMRLNLRSVPGLDGRVLGIVPEGVALGSAQRTRRWFRVTFEGRTGWIFAAYVSTNGACGE